MKLFVHLYSFLITAVVLLVENDSLRKTKTCLSELFDTMVVENLATVFGEYLIIDSSLLVLHICVIELGQRWLK